MAVQPSAETAAAVATIVANPGTFLQLVAELQQQDNDARKKAEEVFELLKEKPDLCVSCLVHTMRSSPAVDARSFSAIMLRKVGAGGD